MQTRKKGDSEMIIVIIPAYKPEHEVEDGIFITEGLQ